MAETWRERLTSAAFSAGWGLVCRLPEPVARAAFNAGADIAWRRQGAGVQVLEGNLARILSYDPGERPPAAPGAPPLAEGAVLPGAGPGGAAPATPQSAGASVPGVRGGDAGDAGRYRDLDVADLRALSREVMRSYARYYLEAFRLQIIPDERIRAGMHVNQDAVDLTLEHLKNGRGVIYALPHMGDFEQAGRWVILAGAGSFTTVAERLKPEALFQRFLAFRQGLGMEVLATTGGPHPFGVMAQRLRAGKLVCIVADRDLSDTGVEVEFFGEKALFPAGPAALAVQTGAALNPVSCSFVGETEWAAHVYPEIPVPAEGSRKEKAAAMTQALARVFEQAIREHPDDWHMLQKVFVSDLDPERLAGRRGRVPNGKGAGAAVAAPAATATASGAVSESGRVSEIGTVNDIGAVDGVGPVDETGPRDGPVR